jgi:hypothetical protein
MPTGTASTWEGVPDSYVLQQVSCVERVTGIETALSAWEDFSCLHGLLSRTGFGGLRRPLVTPTGLV